MSGAVPNSTPVGQSLATLPGLFWELNQSKEKDVGLRCEGSRIPRKLNTATITFQVLWVVFVFCGVFFPAGSLNQILKHACCWKFALNHQMADV